MKIHRRILQRRKSYYRNFQPLNTPYISLFETKYMYQMNIAFLHYTTPLLPPGVVKQMESPPLREPVKYLPSFSCDFYPLTKRHMWIYVICENCRISNDAIEMYLLDNQTKYNRYIHIHS